MVAIRRPGVYPRLLFSKSYKKSNKFRKKHTYEARDTSASRALLLLLLPFLLLLLLLPRVRYVEVVAWPFVARWPFVVLVAWFPFFFEFSDVNVAQRTPPLVSEH